jgi:hypothetical protein
MRKIIPIFALAALFVALPITSAYSSSVFTNLRSTQRDIDWTGQFLGAVGHPDPDSEDPIVVGYMVGLFKTRGRGGFFVGNITNEDQSQNGNIAGFFGRHFMIGRIKGDQGSLPFVGFIGSKQDNETFFGRAMSIIGPPLYFWGTFTPN